MVYVVLIQMVADEVAAGPGERAGLKGARGTGGIDDTGVFRCAQDDHLKRATPRTSNSKNKSRSPSGMTTKETTVVDDNQREQKQDTRANTATVKQKRETVATTATAKQTAAAGRAGVVS
jgi:hypothetical protein